MTRKMDACEEPEFAVREKQALAKQEQLFAQLRFAKFCSDCILRGRGLGLPRHGPRIAISGRTRAGNSPRFR